MAAPEAIPPAAINGNVVACRTAGTRVRVVVSSRPLCPPASKPSATIASTPAAWAFRANFTELTTCTTVIPAALSVGVHRAGLPAEVKTIGIFSSNMILMMRSISGYNKGTLTPKGLFVADLHFCTCAKNTSGCIDPAPIRPNPPALLTAAASRQPLAHTIPACTIGYRTPNKFPI